MNACVDGCLAGIKPKWSEDRALGVFLASEGYPKSPRTGDVIHGLDDASRIPGIKIFHAGTVRQGTEIRTAGGRVVLVMGRAPLLQKAADLVYKKAIPLIRWPGMYFRPDIGKKAFDYLRSPEAFQQFAKAAEHS